MQVELTKREIELIMESVNRYSIYIIEAEDDGLYDDEYDVLNDIYFKLKDINGQ